jgi:hypothetical protein
MAFVTITGLSGAAVMAWLSAQLSWFWGTFQWFGVVGVGLVVWLLIGIGLSLYRNSLPTFGAAYRDNQIKSLQR